MNSPVSRRGEPLRNERKAPGSSQGKGAAMNMLALERRNHIVEKLQALGADIKEITVPDAEPANKKIN